MSAICRPLIKCQMCTPAIVLHADVLLDVAIEVQRAVRSGEVSAAPVYVSLVEA
jgi:hypothetical protein